MTFKKILVPVDFSTNSAEAMRVAADLSRHFEGKLTLVHVFQPISYALPEGYVMYSAGQYDELLAAFEAQLLNAKKETKAAGALSVETTLLQGLPGMAISELASAQKFDLIVMGTHGRSGLKHLMLGSVAERVLRHAPCPVLIVHTPSARKS
jgi:nucleotide-binding universal stress UspA family protein